MVFTLLASPLPAKVRFPEASWISTHESAEKLKRNRARPAPGKGGAGASAAFAIAGIAAAPTAVAPTRAELSRSMPGEAVAGETTPDSMGTSAGNALAAAATAVSLFTFARTYT